MAVSLPARLTGYGAYNLCFDKYLGRKTSNPADPDFFAAIRQKGFNRINLVKVICFRNAQKENLPLDRAVPIYIRRQAPPPYPQVIVNPAFLDNLSALGTSAAQHNFWVQVCIFHQQAISTPYAAPGKEQELPKEVPPELAQDGNATACARLKKFFNPRPANPEQLARQKELVNMIVTRLKNAPNVLFELGNELRIEGGDCQRSDNCLLAEWLNIMGNEVIKVVGQTNKIGTSTGCYAVPPTPKCNEVDVFSACQKHFFPGFFDFHHGQWYSETDLAGAIRQAKTMRADVYKENIPTPLIINDDGADGTLRKNNVETWAKTTFGLKLGLHYSSKQPYPNGGTIDDFDPAALAALDRAAATP